MFTDHTRTDRIFPLSPFLWLLFWCLQAGQKRYRNVLAKFCDRLFSVIKPNFEDLQQQIESWLESLSVPGESKVEIKYPGGSFYVDKDFLKQKLPAFDTCFGNSEFVESKIGLYEIKTFSRAALECMLVFCATGILLQADDMDYIDYMEVAKFAHQYEMKDLLQLCEIRVLQQLPDIVSTFGIDPTGLANVYTTASLLKLSLVLVGAALLVEDEKPTCTPEIAEQLEAAQKSMKSAYVESALDLIMAQCLHDCQ